MKLKEKVQGSLVGKEQYRAVSELVLEAQADNTYYALIILSSVIISAGVLLANSAILIGGMLITPLLSPILLIALGIVTSKPRLIKRTSLLILKSIGLIFAISFMTGLIFEIPENREFFSSVLFNNTMNAAFLYFLVALASGVAATFSWVRKEMKNIMAGISIAISLVPPISLVAIWLANNDPGMARIFLLIFLFNLFGIIMSSMIVFSMLKFYRAGNHVTHAINKIEEPKILDEKNVDDKKV
jgi:uncharacterized hydrophobic protein (TIGR00271 family)